MSNEEDANLSQEEVRPVEDVVENQEVEPEIVEGEEANQKPTHVPMYVIDKQKARTRKAEAKAEELQRQLEAKQQEADLLMLGQVKPEEEALTLPNQDDYVDMAEYAKDVQSYLDANKESVLAQTREEVIKTFETQRQQEAQTAQQQAAAAAQEEARKEYLKSADSLNAPDFLDADDRLRQSLTPDFYSTLITRYKDTPELGYEIGSSQENIDELINEFNQQPNFTAGLAHVLQTLDARAAALKTKPSDIVEADEAISGGAGGVSNYDSQLEKMRDKQMKGAISMNELLKWKSANKPRNAA